MMKKLLFLNLLLASLFLVSQNCEVNFSQTGFLEDPAGSYPLQIQSDGTFNIDESSFTTDLDTLTALPNILTGQNYSTSFGIRIPADTSIVYDLGAGPQLFEGVQITSISISEVQGLPAGFSYACDNSDCSWSGGDFGCASIYSTGAVSSDLISSGSQAFPLNFVLSVDATYEVFGLPVPLTDIEVSDLLNFYVLVIEEGNGDSFVSENFSNDKLLFTVDLEGKIVKKSKKNVVLIDIYESGKIYKRFEK